MPDIMLREYIDETVARLKLGKIILYPTDTVWGIGCDALNTEAIERVYAIKKRPSEKPMIVLVADITMLKEYAVMIHPRVETLLALHKRPLTIVYPETRGLPESVQSPTGSVAIRIVGDPFCREVIAALGKPIISTSANVNGYPHPGSFADIDSALIRSVDYVVPIRQHETNSAEPSVIASYDHKGRLSFLRE